MPSKRSHSESMESQSPTKRVKSESSQPTTPAPVPPPVKIEFQTHNPARPTKGRKKGVKAEEMGEGAQLHVSPFKATYDDDLSLDRYYTVEPAKEWDSMRKYNKFVLLGHTHMIDSYVYVQADPDEKASGQGGWVGRILDIRAIDQQRVYALVCWMYWPIELPSGKKPYHGRNELVASNHLDVIDVLTVSGAADVSHWSEEDTDPGSTLYWRQTHNETTGELSKVREHCTCHKYFNPDVPMYACDNVNCGILRHKECIIDNVLTDAYQKEMEESGTPNGTSSSKKTKKRPYSGILSGKMIEEEGGPLKIEISDSRRGKKKTQERAPCPKCGTELQN